MIFSLYDHLDSYLESDNEIKESSESSNGFLDSSRVTVVAINYFDNGLGCRGKWSSSRYALNWQMFDLTEPFTPSRRLAAWYGTTQMHETDFFEGYFDAKGHSRDMGSTCWEFYREVMSSTRTMPKVEGRPVPMLGQFITKYPGTLYHYGCIARTHWDEYGELTCDLFLDQKLHARILVDRVANNLKDPKNLLRGRYDPQRLWRGKNQRAKA